MPANKEAMTLVVISSLFVIVIYSSVVKFNAFGQNGSYEHCTYTGQYPPVDDLSWTSNCCWSKTADSGILAKATPPIMVCQICKGVGFQKQCSPAHQRVIATLRPAGPQQPPPKPTSPPPTSTLGPSPSTSLQQRQQPTTTTTTGGHHHKGSNSNLQGGQEPTPSTTKKGKAPKTG
jgi:hypothetical protein